MINTALSSLPAPSSAEHAAADAPAFPAPASLVAARNDEAPFAFTMRQKLMAQDRHGLAAGRAPAPEKVASGVSPSRRALPGVKSAAAKVSVKVSEPAPAMPRATKMVEAARRSAPDVKSGEAASGPDVKPADEPPTLPVPPAVELVADLPVSAAKDVSSAGLVPVPPLVTNLGSGSDGGIFTRAELARQQADATSPITAPTPTGLVTPNLFLPTPATSAVSSVTLPEGSGSSTAKEQSVVAAAPTADNTAVAKAESAMLDAFVPSADTGDEAKKLISPSVASLRADASGLHGTSAAKNGDAMSRSDELAVRQEAGPTITTDAATSFGSPQGDFYGQSRSEGEFHSAKSGLSAETVASTMATASAPAQSEPMRGDTSAMTVAAPVRSQEILAQVSRHAVELKQWNLTSMSVVLRPDANTELFLQLNQREGGIEVQARVERGDAAGLNEEWGALQRSLATQGVRLSALENDRAIGGGDLRSGPGSGNISAATARGMANGRELDAGRLGLAAADASSRTAAEFGSAMNQLNELTGRSFGSPEHSRGEPGDEVFRYSSAFEQQQRDSRALNFEDLVPAPGREAMKTPAPDGVASPSSVEAAPASTARRWESWA